MIVIIDGAAVIVAHKKRASLVMRSSVNFTSSAVMSEPSWNFTPSRRVSFKVVSSAHSYSVARQGCIFISESRVSRGIEHVVGNRVRSLLLADGGIQSGQIIS